MTALKTQARRLLAGPTKQVWRSVLPHLPPRLVEAVRGPAKRSLRRAGLLGEAASNGPVAASTEPTVLVTPTPSAVAPPKPPAEPSAPALPTPPPAECPICDTVAESFLPFGARRPAPDRKCPGCGSLERHRMIWLYFRTRTNLFTDQVRMLHIAPEPFFDRQLRTQENIDYLSADIESSSAMMQMDITDIDFPDASFDVVYASHVLEHIPDDGQAMRELSRVLKPGGWAVLQVPIWGEATREDLSVTDPKERERLYGQFDHVRMYGHDGEYERRLQNAGFDVSVEQFVRDLGPEQARRYRLMQSEDIYLCTKRQP